MKSFSLPEEGRVCLGSRVAPGAWGKMDAVTVYTNDDFDSETMLHNKACFIAVMYNIYKQ